MNDHGRTATQRNGWIWCALAAVLFGAATPATKLVVDHIGSVTLAGLLYLGAAAAVAPFALRQPRRAAAARQRSLLLLAVGLGGGVAPVLLVLALHCATAGTVSRKSPRWPYTPCVVTPPPLLGAAVHCMSCTWFTE